jgi:hypothetical protein
LDGRTEVKQYTPSPFGERGYNKTYSYNITEILWKVALNTITLTLQPLNKMLMVNM